jgi:predicted sulfurtransferase
MEKILIYYKYVDITYPKQILKWQKKLCEQLELKGRIILAHEGINATVGGSIQSLERYKTAMDAHPLFGQIDFKESPGSAADFPRLRIVIKNEIVHLGLDPQRVRAHNGGVHLTPEQAHTLMAKKDDDILILDCRNRYETAIGTFTNAVRPPTQYFREFPAYVDAHADLFKDKTVVMACTAGVRCERASAYLKSKGIAKQVYQIKGGIHRYIEQFPNGFFKGKNYVFDQRLAVPVTDDILGNCSLCNTACDEYTNCLHAACNKHFIGCTSCVNKYQNTCSAECFDLVFTQHAPQRPLFKKRSLAPLSSDTTAHESSK